MLRWFEDESRPLSPEPLSVTSREFMPSVNLGIKVDFGAYVESLRDLLSDKDVYDPAAVDEVQKVLGADAEGARVRARREDLSLGHRPDRAHRRRVRRGLGHALVAARAVASACSATCSSSPGSRASSCSSAASKPTTRPPSCPTPRPTAICCCASRPSRGRARQRCRAARPVRLSAAAGARRAGARAQCGGRDHADAALRPRRRPAQDRRGRDARGRRLGQAARARDPSRAERGHLAQRPRRDSGSRARATLRGVVRRARGCGCPTREALVRAARGSERAARHRLRARRRQAGAHLRQRAAHPGLVHELALRPVRARGVAQDHPARRAWAGVRLQLAGHAAGRRARGRGARRREPELRRRWLPLRASSPVRRAKATTVSQARSLRMPIMRVAPDSYGKFASFCRAVDQAEAGELTIQLP